MIQPEYKVVVQEIKVTWSKDSRGGSRAMQRNNIALTLALPLFKVSNPYWFVLEHQINFDEINEFTNPRESVSSYKICATFHHRHLDVIFEEKQAQVVWAHEVLGGAVYVPIGKPIFALQVGEWGQVMYNYRNAHNGYEKRILNLGLFDQVSPDTFTNHSPAYTFHKIVPLY